MRVSKLKKCIMASVIFAVMSFAMIVSIYFLDSEVDAEQGMASYIIASVFWLSFVGQMIAIGMATRERGRLQKDGFASQVMEEAKIGLLSFFKNIEGKIADIVLFISLLTIIVSIWKNVSIGWIVISSVSIFCLSFQLHCILNGRNYRYLKEHIQKEKERKEYE